MPKSPSKKGKDAEIRVARSLRGKGANVKVSKASRTAADLRVKFPTGTKWNIQVKSSRRGAPASPSPKDVGRLKQGATKTRATPVISKVTPKGVQYISARSGRKLTPPPRKKK
jgi:hypothetical protein